MKTKQERIIDLQRQDVEDMALILAAVANGMTPQNACKEIVGGKYKLSEIVLQSILESAAGVCK